MLEALQRKWYILGKNRELEILPSYCITEIKPNGCCGTVGENNRTMNAALFREGLEIEVQFHNTLTARRLLYTEAPEQVAHRHLDFSCSEKKTIRQISHSPHVKSFIFLFFCIMHDF